MFRAKSMQFHDANRDQLFTRVGTRRVWILIVLLTTAVSCKVSATSDLATPGADPLADQSFLTQQPCASPCWHDVVPGQSTVSEVRAVLAGLQFIDQSTIVESNTTWYDDLNATVIGFGCLHPKDEKCGGSAVISNGILKRLNFSPPPDLTLQKAVEVLGEPTHVDYYPFHPEAGGCIIRLIWFPQEISVTSVDRDSKEQCQKIQQNGHVAPNALVDSIMYIGHEPSATQPIGCINCYLWPGFAK